MHKYQSILKIPEGICGGYSIRHAPFEADKVFHTASGRTTLMGGDKKESFSFGHPGHFHELHSDKDGCWMQDVPIEQAQTNAILKRCHYQGRVLVGGLGLGYVLTRIARKPGVEEIVVVEIAQEVIDLVFPHLEARVRNKTTVVCEDLFKYLEATAETFDHGFYDTWQSDGEGTFFETVVPLIHASQGVLNNQPDCWNEHIMRGQLAWGLESRAVFLAGADVFSKGKTFIGTPEGFPTLDDLCTLQDSIWIDWSVPFFQWYREVSPKKEALRNATSFYAANYGLPSFEVAWKTFTKVGYPAALIPM